MRLRREQPSERDFHTLGTAPDASPEEVKAAYRELAKRWHPDLLQRESPAERQRAEELFKEISAAYRRISASWDAAEKGGSVEEAPSTTPGTAGPPPSAASAPRKRRRSGSGTYTSPPSGASAATGAGSRYAPSTAMRKLFDTCSAVVDLLRRNRRPTAAFILLLLSVSLLAFLPLFGRSPQQSRVPVSPDGASPSLRVSEPVPSSAPGVPEIDRFEAPPILPPAEPPATLPARPSKSPYFTIGSPQAEVLRIQGVPTRIHGQTWSYNLSDVHFRDGIVWRYNNFDGSLKVHVGPSAPPGGSPPEFFSLGSTKDEVLAIQGTPSRVEENRWYFGFSEVRFRGDRVAGFDNFFGNLKIRLLPSPSYEPAAPGDYFTIGSGRDEVLAVQGTPTSIQGNLWFYQFSNVLFRNGKVQGVVNSGGNLRFLDPEDTYKVP